MLDASTKAGAERLASTITNYWTAKGQTVDVRVEPMEIPGFSSPLWVVRSSLVSGLPVRSVARAA